MASSSFAAPRAAFNISSLGGFASPALSRKSLSAVTRDRVMWANSEANERIR
ncbi:MAG: hypothetical protein EOR46_25175 [Mesorhizobium sp.]|nr:MAG: hypothetical protein EOQ33_27780 [Mesorhizobium sp.]RWD10422.1 MAG: hypothetical protein EOS74_29370 [Mesorhizobium sp.]RWD28667.1 MAG: hypothetical protein EOS34_29645 [Mesorhizobium sp.]RWE98585.1 MAG: hypothetical protein EOS43_17375 [Mesorhizobium sp.]RWF66296.1 MAG: hypothetical protein EOS47_06850 [Mesorhizobium sp.]